MHRQADTDFNLLSTFKNNHTFTSERVSVEGCSGDKTSLFKIDVNKNCSQFHREGGSMAKAHACGIIQTELGAESTLFAGRHSLLHCSAF